MKNLVYMTLLLINCGVRKNLSQFVNSNVVRIELRILDDKLFNLIGDSLECNNEYLVPYFDYSEVTLNDLEEILGVENVTITEAFTALNIKLNDFYGIISRNILIDIINNSELSLSKLYSLFVNYFLLNPIKDIPQLLRSLQINEIEFTHAVISGSDVTMLELLLKGNYCISNVEEALKVVNKNVTLNNVFNFIQKANLKNVYVKTKSLHSTLFVVTSFKRLLLAENVVRFLTLVVTNPQMFYKNPTFKNVLSNVTDTQETLIGTVVSAREIVTHGDSLTVITYKILENYTELVAIYFENPSLEYSVQNFSLQNTTIIFLNTVIELLEVTSLNVSNVTRIGDFSDCYYASVNNNNQNINIESTAPFLNDDFITIIKNNKTKFNLGSPLVCNNTLCGVADWEFDTTITFVKFYSDECNEIVEKSEEVGFFEYTMTYIQDVSSSAMQNMCEFFKYLNFNICTL